MGGFCSQAPFLAPFTLHLLPREPSLCVQVRSAHAMLHLRARSLSLTCLSKLKEPVTAGWEMGRFEVPLKVLWDFGA